ncbi:MAG: pilin [Candidatus Buchananbacteria bacterium]
MKKNFKFILALTITSAVFFVTLASLSLAQTESTGGLGLSSKLQTVGTAANFAEKPKISLLIGQIIKTVLSILGVIFMVYTVYAGYLWMTAAGNDEQIKKAKSIIKGSIIGLIIVLAAYTITSFVINNVIGAINNAAA